MDELLEILEDIDPDNDYENDEHLIDDAPLDSLSLLQLVSELEDTFDIQVTPTELIPANFNSAKAIWAMVQRLQQEG